MYLEDVASDKNSFKISFKNRVCIKNTFNAYLETHFFQDQFQGARGSQNPLRHVTDT